VVKVAGQLFEGTFDLIHSGSSLEDDPASDSQISCQYRNSAKTEDIWLKSALEGKSGASWITENNLLKREVRAFPVNLHSKIIQKAEYCREKFEEKKSGDVLGKRQRAKR
jgi:hypothetical protein